MKSTCWHCTSRPGIHVFEDADGDMQAMCGICVMVFVSDVEAHGSRLQLRVIKSVKPIRTPASR